MATFAAYYDASGTEVTGRPLVLVGIVSTEQRWKRFERDWVVLLASFGVPYLHMKEYAFSLGPFADWKGDDDKRAAFLAQAVRAIKRRLYMAFEAHVLPEDFRAVNQRYDLQGLPKHLYSVVGIGAVQAINEWMSKRHPGCPIHHVFESGDVGQSTFFRHVRADLRAGMSIRPKRDAITGEWFSPFQAADLVAYEYRRALEHHVEGKQSPRRASFRELVRMLPMGQIFWNQQKLIEMCEKQPDLFPIRTSDAASS